MNKLQLKRRVLKFLRLFGKDVCTKLGNVSGKTGQYNVPIELYQKRTARKNRVLISWRTVKNNNLTIEQLETFYGGVTVEFLNNDYFCEDNQSNPVFIELKNRLGSDDVVSSIISFRTEEGSSSSAVSREAYGKFINDTVVNYRGQDIIINEDNYRNYAIKKVSKGGSGNDKWSGFVFVSIRGGHQGTIETHRGENLTIFNPACEYANEEVCLDIDLTVAFFALKSIDLDELGEDNKKEYLFLMDQMKVILSDIQYNYDNVVINLYDYCINHLSVSVKDGELTDPIQLKRIKIGDFNIKDNSPDSIDLTHSEAVNKEKYYWDVDRKCILSAARPTNLFWSFHLSNMMQQDFTLEEYFRYEEFIYNKRQEIMRDRDVG